MISVIQNGNVYEIRFRYDPQLIALIKQVPGYWWHNDDKVWTVPKDRLGFFLAQIKGTPYESDVNIQSQEQLNVNHSLDATYEIPDINISDVDFRVEDGKHAFEHQLDFMKFAKWRQEHGHESGFILADQPGAGKAVTLDTKIYTPEGFKYMRDIQVGDQVFDETGNVVNVLATYDHAELNMYNVTFSDDTVVTCCEDHLWEFTVRGDQKVWPLSKIISGSNYGPKDTNLETRISEYVLPRIKPVNFLHKDVYIHPWILGALIGDGSLGSEGTIGFTTADTEIVERFKQLLPNELEIIKHDDSDIHYTIRCKHKVGRKIRCIEDNLIFYSEGDATKHYGVRIGSHLKVSDDMYYSRKLNKHFEIDDTFICNPMISEIRKLGLNCTSKYKHIPEIYRYNDIESRMQLLQGLMDTDGYAEKNNSHVFTTISKQLAEDVVELVESLGGYCTVHEYDSKFNGSVCSRAYDIRIRISNPTQLYTLTRKLERCSARKFLPRRTFKSIEYVGKMPGKCITVDSESHLYLCEHFIPTHNTLEVMNLALYNRDRGRSKHCLIICCVNGAKYNWRDDILKHSNGQEDPYILGSRFKRDKVTVRCNTGGAEKLKDLQTGYKYGKEQYGPLPYFLILNIEALRTKTGKIYTLTQELIEWINKGDIDLIAIDEIHKNASPSSKQGQQLLNIKKKIKKPVEWIPMTGTPITKKPTDVFLPLRLVDGHNTGSYYLWCQDFCVYGGFGGHEIIGYKNIDMLKNMLQPNMLRRLKQDILKNLPPKILYTEYIENTSYQSKLYDSIEAELIDSRDSIVSSLNPMTAFLRLRQVNGAPELVDPELVIDNKYLSKNAKMSRCIEIVDEIVENGEKVIIFSNWVEPLRTLYKFISKKYKTCCYTGTMASDVREKHKQVFMTNPNYPVMIGTVGAMGTSHTLTAARNIIFYDEPWNPSDREQCEDRCHRPGAEHESIKIYTLIANDTVDERVHKILHTKQGIANYVVDNELDIRSHPELFDIIMGNLSVR